MEFTRIDNDTNGNPRYVTHFCNLLTDAESYNGLSIDDQYRLALNRAKKIGGKKYHNKKYGGGIVFQSYNTKDLKNSINNLLK